jgi:hypothetical protein
MDNHGKSFQAAQRAWDNMEPDNDDGDHSLEADDDCELEDPRIADYEWDKLGGER